MVQWLNSVLPLQGGRGSIPGRGSSACRVLQPKKKKEYVKYMSNEEFLKRYRHIHGKKISWKGRREAVDSDYL